MSGGGKEDDGLGPLPALVRLKLLKAGGAIDRADDRGGALEIAAGTAFPWRSTPVAMELLMTLPKASSATCTTGCVVKAVPATVGLEAGAAITSLLAAALLIT